MYALAAHTACGQVRKYTGEPYINHPFRVASQVQGYGGDRAMVAAALLHDVVEDTQVSVSDIRHHFGSDVAQLVDELTDVSRPSDGNRAERKALDLAHTATASPRAKTIKLADLFDNTADIVRHDPKFAKTYLAEKHALMEVLREGDIGGLWGLVKRQLDDALKSLKESA